MNRREFLTLTTIVSTSCSSLSSFKKGEIIYLDKEFFENWLRSDGLGNYYLNNLDSKDIAVRINFNDKNKYTLGDYVRILVDKRFKYPYKDRTLPVYEVKEKYQQ